MVLFGGDSDAAFGDAIIRKLKKGRYSHWAFEEGSPSWAQVHGFSRRFTGRKSAGEVADIILLAGGMDAILGHVALTPELVSKVNIWLKAHGKDPLGLPTKDA